MDKQAQIIRYLSGKKQATSDEIYENVPYSYYHNPSKHFSQVMCRLVNSGRVERIKPGVFRLKQNQIINIETLELS